MQRPARGERAHPPTQREQAAPLAARTGPDGRMDKAALAQGAGMHGGSGLARARGCRRHGDGWMETQGWTQNSVGDAHGG